MPFESQIVATPSDCREKMMPAQEKIARTTKTISALICAVFGQASADQPFHRISRRRSRTLNLRAATGDAALRRLGPLGPLGPLPIRVWAG